MPYNWIRTCLCVFKAVVANEWLNESTEDYIWDIKHHYTASLNAIQLVSKKIFFMQYKYNFLW